MQIQTILQRPKPSRIEVDNIFTEISQSLGVMQINAESTEDYEQLANYLLPQK